MNGQTDKTIAPIQTRYRGYNFRSRLEARYAVFFDALGLEWEYETEGYDLGNLGWYLPDFYFPQTFDFCEVKPTNQEKLDKYEAFVKVTKHPIILLEGQPNVKFYRCCILNPLNENTVLWILKIINNHHQYYKDEHRFYSCPGCDDPEREGVVDESDYCAVNKSRSARFEHGESGPT